ncbi:MAG: hypothetical protein ACTHMC_13545 [Pseudobacter sp.]|uniref:hypothetical protein n=1 Tax=Pseudobacter sp. TaxID=2045420 RepID=UPI003F7EDE72
MKSVKFAFAALVLAGGIVAAFAFTAPKKKAIDTWYTFNTGVATTVANVTDPANYTYFGTTAPAAQFPDVNLQAIKVDAASEVYTSGTYTGKPIVNVANTLQTAILDATGLDGSAKNEIANRVILKP